MAKLISHAPGKVNPHTPTDYRNTAEKKLFFYFKKIGPKPISQGNAKQR